MMHNARYRLYLARLAVTRTRSWRRWETAPLANASTHRLTGLFAATRSGCFASNDAGCKVQVYFFLADGHKGELERKDLRGARSPESDSKATPFGAGAASAARSCGTHNRGGCSAARA